MIYGKKSALLMAFLMLLMSLTACNDHQMQANKSHARNVRPLQCLEQQSSCSFDVAGGRVEVLFDSNKIIAEQVVNMVVKYHGAQTLTNISGYLEGVEMFMGKIPLFLIADNGNEIEAGLENSKKLQAQTFNAELLVGSCSAEKMTWRMWLTFTTSDQQTHNQVLSIVSYRN